MITKINPPSSTSIFIIPVVVILLLLVPVRAKPADVYADSILQLAASMPDNAEKVDLLIKVSKHYYRIDYDSALIYCSRAADLADQVDYPEGTAEALYIQSLVCKNRSELVKSQEYLDRFLEISRSIGDSIRLAKGYHQQGNLLDHQGNFELSVVFYKKSLEVYFPLKDTHAIVANFNSIANNFKSRAEYDSASVYFMKAIALTEKQRDNRKLAILYRNLGDNYFMSRYLDAARSYFDRSLELCRALPNMEKEIGNNYNCLARVSVEENNYREALEFYSTAALYFEKAGFRQGLIDLDNNVGHLYFQQEEYDKAIPYFDRAMMNYKALGFNREFVIAMDNKATALARKGQYNQALILYDSCLKITISMGSKELRMNVLKNMAILYESMGNYKRANEYYARHHDLKDSIFDLEKTKIISELLLKYEKEQDQAQILLMEKENLEKDVTLEQRTRQLHSYLYGSAGLVVCIVFLFSYYNQRTRKNRIIAEQRIHQLEEEKKLLAARSIVEGQEEERRRIAKELHDGLGVLLSSAKMHFTNIRDKSPEAQPMIEKASKLLEQATGDVRRISHNMMPGLLTRYGFYEAVEDLVEQVHDMDGMHAEVNIVGKQSRLKENTEIMLYRIVQEMVNNTLKHADAKAITLDIQISPDNIALEYKDDGKGFNFDEKIKLKSMGLTSLQSRVKFLGGELQYSSSPGNGTRYTFEVPV